MAANPLNPAPTTLRPLDVVGELVARDEELLTASALALAALLHECVAEPRAALLRERRDRRSALATAPYLTFTAPSIAARDTDWRVAPSTVGLADEPTWIADLDEASAPYWSTVVTSHLKVIDMLADAEQPAVVVRPRGWHAQDRNVLADGWPISATALDVALHLSHVARAAHGRGGSVILALPDVQDSREAALWDAMLSAAEEHLGLPTGTVRVVVAVESLPAALDIEAIVHTLRHRLEALGLDTPAYLSSVVQCLGTRTSIPEQTRPGAGNPALQAVADLIVSTARRRGARLSAGIDPRLAQAGERIITANDLACIATAPLSQADVRRAMRRALAGIANWLEGTSAVVTATPGDARARIELARAQLWQWRALGAQLDDGRLLDDGLIAEWMAESAADLTRERGTRGLAQAVELLGDLVRDRDTSRTFTSVAYHRWVAAAPSMDLSFALPDLLLASA